MIRLPYSVSYTPTNGREAVDHKWVIEEEIEEAIRETALEPGTEITTNADHMK